MGLTNCEPCELHTVPTYQAREVNLCTSGKAVMG